MFAIPWQERVLIGTTDLACEWVPLEPRPTNQEIDFLLETAGRYLDREPTRADVLSAVAGIRPLVQSAAARGTAKLSRDHTLLCSRSGLLTITGGKWTTYRRMAQDAVDRAVAPSGLATGPCVTGSLPIHGHTSPGASADPSEYGSDAPEFDRLCQSDAALAERLHGRLPYVAGHVVWAARREMARTVDDVLSRRTRALWLDAQAASEAAPRVATLLARELGRDAHWQSEQIAAFQALAKDYLIAK